MEHKHAFPAQDLKLGKIIGGEVTIDGTIYRPFNATGYAGRFDKRVMCFAVVENDLAFLWGTAEAMAAKQAESEPTHVMIPEEFRTGDWRWWMPDGWVSPAMKQAELTLEDLTKAQLQPIASERGIETKGMNKAEIIAAIREMDAAAAAEAEKPEEPEQPEEPAAETPDPSAQEPTGEPAENPGEEGNE